MRFSAFARLTPGILLLVSLVGGIGCKAKVASASSGPKFLAPAAPSPDAASAGGTADDTDTIVLFKNPKAAPALHVATLDGKSTVDLAAQKGRVVLLNFWATWCGPCRQEIPEFEKLQTQYQGKVQVIGLSVDELPPSAVAQAATKLGINYPVGMAPDDIQTRFGGMPEIPVTLVIDTNGQIVQKHRGGQSYDVFNNEVRALLGMPITAKIMRIDQLAPNGKVGTIDIPGIGDQLKELTPAQRNKALGALNSQQCTCGCDCALAYCRVQDPSCSQSLPLSQKLIAAIKAGKPIPQP